MKPKVSIILPTYNGSKWINEAVESVVNQSYTDWELLVVDDGSTDDTGAIMTEYIQNDSRIRYIKNEQNLGIQKSLNRGFKEAQGEYIARIDSDDEWCDKDKLKKQIEFLEYNQDYVLVGTGVIVVGNNKKEFSRYFLPETDIAIRRKILSKNCFIHSSVVFKKKDIVGGYSENIEDRHIEDYDLWLRLGLVGKFKNLPFYGVLHRVGDSTLTGSNRAIQAKNMLNRIKKSKNDYSFFVSGYLISSLRFWFFKIQKYIPFSKKMFYFLQLVYKKF